jgi:hypothetical protein
MKKWSITRRLLVFVILPASVLYFGLKMYATTRPVKIYVSRSALMPPTLATNLHMKEHGIDPVVRIESPYERAEDKMLSPDEIRHLRRQIVWNNLVPSFFDSLTIQDSNHVIVRRVTRRSFAEYQLARNGSKWSVAHIERNSINPQP